MRLRRILAHAATSLAACVGREDQSLWRLALRRELDEIEHDGAALSWALGGLWTSLASCAWARWTLAAAIALPQASYIYSTAIVFGFRKGWIDRSAFANQADFETFALLVSGTPYPMLMLWTFAHLSFLTAAGLVIRRSPAAPLAFAAGVAAWLLQTVQIHASEVYRQVLPPLAFQFDYLIAASFAGLGLAVVNLSRARTA